MTRFALALLLVACAVLIGCGATIEAPPPEPPPRVTGETIGTHGTIWVSEVTVDDESYVVVNTAHGIAICPKVKPEAAK